MEGDRDEVDIGLDGAGGDGGAATATADNGGDGAAQDNYTAMQDRMAGDDEPWYSSSEGKVVTKDGEVITDPATGLPFRSMDAFEKWQAKQPAAQTTAKPKTDGKNAQQQILGKSFDALMGATDGQVPPEKLYAYGKAGSDYAYADDLIPKISQPANGQSQQQAAAPVDPIERVRTERAQIESVAINPIRDIKAALVAQGADAALVDQLLAPILQKQTALVEEHYQKAYEQAMIERMDSKYAPQMSKIEKDKTTNAANANIAQLSAKYYPEGGKEALFSLINGHYADPNDKNSFVRGPSAQVIDLLAAVSMDGKQFSSLEERSGAYKDMFEKMMADPVKARAVVDIAHYYWLGKQSHKAQALVFEKGKQSAINQQKTVNKTIKTRPGQFGAPQTTDDDEGMPSILRDAIRAGR